MPPSLLDDLDAALAGRPKRNPRKLDLWLEKHPDRRAELAEAAAWFWEHRSNDFGWATLAKVLTSKWPDFPTGDAHLRSYFTEEFPPEAPGGH